MAIFKEVESQTLKNDEIAASGREQTISGTLRVDYYNTLLVHNIDANSNVEVRVNGDTTRFFIAEKNGGIVQFDAEAGIKFSVVHLINLNAAAVVANDAVTVRASKAVEVK